MMRHCIIAILSCMACWQCGYNSISGNNLFGAKRMLIIPFAENQPTGMGARVNQHLTYFLTASGMEITQNQDDADVILTGIISTSAGSNATRIGVQTYILGAGVHATLKRVRDGSILWEQGADAREEFLPIGGGIDTQPLLIETNRRVAIVRVAENLAKQLHAALLFAGSR